MCDAPEVAAEPAVDAEAKAPCDDTHCYDADSDVA
jgi:hypothetical protein